MTLFELLNIVPVIAGLILSAEVDPIGDAMGLLFVVGSTLWITRGRSLIGRKIYTGMAIFGGAALAVAAFYVENFLGVGTAQLVAALLFSFAMTAAMLALLWHASTSAWLKEGRPTART